MALREIGDQNFETEVLKAPGVVLVDFWAPWCAPCRVQHPILEELAGEMKNVTFASINVDEHPTVGGRYQIMSIPTLIAFKGGAPVAQFIGLQSKEALRAKLGGL
ncbi:MAG: thioredoxin [bacterium]|nr:thioredoxin [bacterium]